MVAAQVNGDVGWLHGVDGRFILGWSGASISPRADTLVAPKS
jgi:hypothetical protein